MTSVKLYVYDLSNGLARSMSLQLTGKQIDGIWHTSIVVYGMEVFYGGQGIEITSPGTSHHGRPLRVENLGETDIDRETFEEYINQMRDHYLGNKYHLLEFNCNSFTNDCVGFLTGKEIPSYIKDLPTEFLSTPFGAALRPTIDSMFRGSAIPPAPQASTSNTLLETVAARAAGPHPVATSQSNGDASVLAAPLQIATNPATLRSVLSRHKAVAVYFTSDSCPPCRVVEPIFEDLAHSKASAGVAFVKVNLSVGMSSAIASEYGVRATPTFIFFNDGKKTAELKGANVPELRSNVDLMIFQSFPPHPHTKLDLRTIRGISLEPILYKQKPSIQAAYAKLETFIGSSSAKGVNLSASRQIFSQSLLPWLETYNNKYPAPPAHADVEQWRAASLAVGNALEVDKLFPLLDFWRLIVLESRIGPSLAANPEPFRTFLTRAKLSLEGSLTELGNPRNTYVTLLRFLSNVFSSHELASQMLNTQLRQHVVSVIVPSLLHSDAAVRSAAAGAAFNSAAYYQKARVGYYRDGRIGDPVPETTGDEEWETEMITALLEALSQETRSEEVVHRLTAAFALLVHLSPHYEEQVKPLLEVLQAKQTVKSKLDPKSFDGKGIAKKEIRDLLHEVAIKLCP